ncbi:MAG: serine protease [Candidatus Paceibacterota bacterium]
MEKLKKYKYLILIVLIILIVCGVSYFGVKQYKKYQTEIIKKENITQKQRDSEVEKLKQEVEALKNNKLANGPFISPTAKPVFNYSIKSKVMINDEESIIQQWRPRVAYIECKAEANNIKVAEQSGSGYLFSYDSNGAVFFLTNKHVITFSTLGQSFFPTSCDIRMPMDTQTATTFKEDQVGGAFSASENKDFTLIRVTNPTSRMTALTDSSYESTCKNKAELGEKILILGYPGIGDKNDITATDGIISGYDGDYYITSAKIEHGNSGGVAISIKNNCFLGIPSFVNVGSVESLARILMVSAIFPN